MSVASQSNCANSSLLSASSSHFDVASINVISALLCVCVCALECLQCNSYRLCICANFQQIQTPNLKSAILFIPFLTYILHVLVHKQSPRFGCHTVDIRLQFFFSAFFYFICFIFKCAFRVQLHYYYIPFLLFLWLVFLCIYYYCFHTDVNEHVQQQQ